MGKTIILQVGNENIPMSKLTYDNLVYLFKNFINKEHRVPQISELSVKNGLPNYDIVRSILSKNNITYKQFRSIFGDNTMLLINGRYKQPKDITYDELVVLYKEYIDKYEIAPTSSECSVKNNLPYWGKIISILNEKGISHDEFLELFGITNGKRKYQLIKIGDMFGRWKVVDSGTPKTYMHHNVNTTMPTWLCECTCGSGIKKEISDNVLKTGSSQSCGCLKREAIAKLKGTYRKQNFSDWCIENGHQDYLDRWDYDKNKVLPSDISYVSHEKIFFKCPCGKHNSSAYQLSSIPPMKELRCKYCYSFAQRFIDVRGENALEKYWDYEKNEVDPWEIPGSSYNKVWLKCTDTTYHGSYQISRDNAIKGAGCPYCNHLKIHPKDSFGQTMIDRYGEENFRKMWNTELNTVDPFAIAPSTRKCKVWLNCIDVDYHPPTEAHPNDINNHTGYCHYCAKIKLCKEDSLGYKFPQVFDIWSIKNKKSPYEYYPTSNEKVWWKCRCGKHDDFLRPINDANAGEFGCPKCSQESSTSKLQNKVSDYLKSKYNYLVLHENECNLKPRNPLTNTLLRYDNEIPDLKLIIEVNGQQHYEICGFTYLAAKYYGTTAEEELKKYQARDAYKMEYALAHGYSYLIIPYWEENNDGYKVLIDNKINEILREAA